jgi:acetyl esterase/lipase
MTASRPAAEITLTTVRGVPGADGAAEDLPPDGELTIPVPAPIRVLHNVTAATLTPVLPPDGSETGAGVLICPGGGYFMVAVDHEGLDVARWLADRGIAAFVLKYRVVPTPATPAEMFTWLAGVAQAPLGELMERIDRFAATPAADGAAALRCIHEHRDEWGVDPAKLGVLGFSAGGRLAFDLAGAPCSAPPASAGPPRSAPASAGAQVAAPPASAGDVAPPAFLAGVYPAFPLDREAPASPPPLFLAVAADDRLVSNALAARAAWEAAGRSPELHLYARGGHGFGTVKQGLPSDGWLERFHEWLLAEALRPAGAGAAPVG